MLSSTSVIDLIKLIGLTSNIGSTRSTKGLRGNIGNLRSTKSIAKIIKDVAKGTAKSIVKDVDSAK
jgi:hypothetical protein